MRVGGKKVYIRDLNLRHQNPKVDTKPLTISVLHKKNWTTEILPKSNQFMKNGFLSRSFLLVIIWDPRRCWFEFSPTFDENQSTVKSRKWCAGIQFFSSSKDTILITQFAHFLPYWYHNSKTAYNMITTKLVLHNTVQYFSNNIFVHLCRYFKKYFEI